MGNSIPIISNLIYWVFWIWCSRAGINNLAIAPKYAGILMGIANTITIPGFVGPQVSTFIAKKVSV